MSEDQKYVWVKCPVGKMSGGQDVWGTKCQASKMSVEQNVQWS